MSAALLAVNELRAREAEQSMILVREPSVPGMREVRIERDMAMVTERSEQEIVERVAGLVRQHPGHPIRVEYERASSEYERLRRKDGAAARGRRRGLLFRMREIRADYPREMYSEPPREMRTPRSLVAIMAMAATMGGGVGMPR